MSTTLFSPVFILVWWRELHDSGTIRDDSIDHLVSWIRGGRRDWHLKWCNFEGSSRNVHRGNEFAGVVSAAELGLEVD